MNQMTDKDKSKNPFALMEEEVLVFWRESDTFRRSVEKEAPQGDYVFYDGPPFITGLPHYATLLPSIAKDMIPRYFTMKGFRVKRVWGWDCHGLPAENKVEKELGLKNKKDIEELGVDKFVSACRDYVNTGTEQWRWYIERIARWVDMDNAYKTMDLAFMESVVWAFKALYEKGLIYEGYRSSLHCPRCATPLSKFEITMDAGSYKDVNDESVIVKFKIKDIINLQIAYKFTNEDNLYVLAWTTTPWTLPGNLALAVGKNIRYCVLSIKGESGKFIAAKDRADEVFKGKEYEILKEISGTDLAGLEYESLFDLKNAEIGGNKNAYKIYQGDFVSTEEGTGIVHIAPNFGEDDFELGKQYDLPLLDLMDEMGQYTDKAGDWAGLYFKKANTRVLESLGEKLFKQETHIHSYPFCYRCDTRLIYKTQKAWYLRISEIRQKMIENNQKINWVPEFFRDGRFKYNLENAPDWCLSRSRYFGSPIPVWRCTDCDEIKVIGSIKELEALSGAKVDDLHRPAIDEPEFACSKCQGRMRRVKEVLDCWFESGSMPFAQFHYPFSSDKEVDFQKPDFPFPSDFIIEYTGQLRGWFYYLHVLSNALFDDVAFKNVIVSGVLAGTDGRKMSKSFGNYPDPRATLDKYGADALRIYFMQSSIMQADDTSLNEKDIQDALRKNVMLLWNVAKFYATFADARQSEPRIDPKDSPHVLDLWIFSRLQQLITELSGKLEAYDLPGASRPVTQFIDDLSTWYLRRSRDRFKSDDEREKQQALASLRFVLIEFAKVLAPLAPFLAEQVWQKASGYDFTDPARSVHLEVWPHFAESSWGAALGEKERNQILEEMAATRKIVELALKARDEAGIKVRQPLQALTVVAPKTVAIKNKYIELIQDEVNVKEVAFKSNGRDISVEFDLNISPELKQEGLKREIVRLVNSLRKEAGLTHADKVKLHFQAGPKISAVMEKFQKEIMKETVSSDLVSGAFTGPASREFQVEGETVGISLEILGS